MSEEAKRVKEYYINAPIVLVETEWEKIQQTKYKRNKIYEITTKIWVDRHVPEYRVAIPENFVAKAEYLEHWDKLYPADMRMITYVPTGRVIYDNTKPHIEAIVYEYILESLLGKKDLIHK